MRLPLSIPFSHSKYLRWLRAAHKEHRCHLPQGKGFRRGLCKEEEPGACIYISMRGDTKEAQGPTYSLGFSERSQEGREAEFLAAISFLLHELHPSTLCIHPPSVQGSGSKITFSGLSSGEMGHKERSDAPAVQTTGPARLWLSLRQCRQAMLLRDGTRSWSGCVVESDDQPGICQHL